MHVAVLGGGLQGCSTAMALADKGVRVTLFDRNSELLSRAAVANEGKIHLGYMYAGDASLNTARMMLQGALSFGPFLSRHLELNYEDLDISTPTVYVVHRRSQKSVDEVGRHLSAVHLLVQDAAAEFGNNYFGFDLREPIARWSTSAVEGEFNPGEVLAAFSSPEVAINPVALAELVRRRIQQTPRNQVRLEHEILSVQGDRPLVVISRTDGVTLPEKFDHVVNALWDGRIALDKTRGFGPKRPWIHRLKYGVLFKSGSGAPLTRSITIVLGPFGEVVCNARGSVYLTWYPHCLKALTREVSPPQWPIQPGEPIRSEIINGTFESLANILPALRACDIEAASDVVVRGGPIVAWGKTDIDDLESELHRRFEIGVTSTDCYHSIDPGKLTTAPLFATECATRIAGPDRRRQNMTSQVLTGA